MFPSEVFFLVVLSMFKLPQRNHTKKETLSNQISQTLQHDVISFSMFTKIRIIEYLLW